MLKWFWTLRLAYIFWTDADIIWKVSWDMAEESAKWNYGDGMSPRECADEEFSCWSD